MASLHGPRLAVSDRAAQFGKVVRGKQFRWAVVELLRSVPDGCVDGEGGLWAFLYDVEVVVGLLFGGESGWEEVWVLRLGSGGGEWRAWREL